MTKFINEIEEKEKNEKEKEKNDIKYNMNNARIGNDTYINKHKNEKPNSFMNELNFDNNSEQQQSVQQEQQEKPKNAWKQNDNPQNFTDIDVPFHVEIQDMDIDSDCWEEAIRCNK